MGIRTNEVTDVYKNSYRYVMAALLLLCPFCTMIPYVAPAVYMTDIMETFGVDMGLAGLSMTILLGATGVCMFLGTFIQDKLGIRISIIVALWGMVLGNLLAFFSPNITIFIIARLVGGFGQGLYMVSMTPCLSTWFSGKERTYMITLDSIANAVALAISYSINRPLANLLGSWKKAFLTYSICIAVVAILWIILSKDNDLMAVASKSTAAPSAKKGGSFVRACKEIQYWKLMLYNGLFFMANSAIATFLPTYLTTVRGIDASIATSISSMNSLAGMIGSIAGGILAAHFSKRKPIILFSVAAYMAAGFGVTFISSGPFVLVLALAAGMLFNLPKTAQSSVMIETKKPFDPTILGGAVTITAGISQLLCVFVSFIFNAITNATNMTTAYCVFFGLMSISFVMALLLKETGVSDKK